LIAIDNAHPARPQGQQKRAAAALHDEGSPVARACGIRQSFWLHLENSLELRLELDPERDVDESADASLARFDHDIDGNQGEDEGGMVELAPAATMAASTRFAKSPAATAEQPAALPSWPAAGYVRMPAALALFQAIEVAAAPSDGDAALPVRPPVAENAVGDHAIAAESAAISPS
jgi:hypothetical protein